MVCLLCYGRISLCPGERGPGKSPDCYLRTTGLCLPTKKVTVNFAPADMKKEGAGFDLPVAAAVLAAAGILEPDLLEGVMIVGEISLNGEIHGVAGVLPRVIRARELGLRFCVIPEENIREGNLVKDMPVFGVKSLNDMIRCLRDPNTCTAAYQEKEKTENKQEKPKVDFADICGQEGARRAAEIAVSGFHNIFLSDRQDPERPCWQDVCRPLCRR